MSVAMDASGNVTAVSRVEALLYMEARLLDERRLEEWLQLFTDDAVYALPIQVSDDPREPSLIRDSKAGMEERVSRTEESW